MTPIWLGIETDEQGRICTATLTGEKPWTHGKTVRYRNVQEFQDGWKGELDGWNFDFSVALDYFEFIRKPSPVADWLTTRREVSIDYFNFSSLYPYFENEVREIPDTFQKAYVLAMCAHHRAQAYRVSKDLLLEVYSLQRRLHRLEEGLHRMAYTIPPPKNEPHALFCPF